MNFRKIYERLTVLIESFVLVLESFLVLLLKFDSFSSCSSVENGLDRGFHFHMSHVIAIKISVKKSAYILVYKICCRFR